MHLTILYSLFKLVCPVSSHLFFFDYSLSSSFPTVRKNFRTKRNQIVMRPTCSYSIHISRLPFCVFDSATPAKAQQQACAFSHQSVYYLLLSWIPPSRPSAAPQIRRTMSHSSTIPLAMLCAFFAFVQVSRQHQLTGDGDYQIEWHLGITSFLPPFRDLYKKLAPPSLRSAVASAARPQMWAVLFHVIWHNWQLKCFHVLFTWLKYWTTYAK